MKNGNYAYSSEDAFSRVFSLTHHIKKLEVHMHRGSWPSIRKAVKNGSYAYSSEDAYSRVFSLAYHIKKLETHWMGLLPITESFLKF